MTGPLPGDWMVVRTTGWAATLINWACVQPGDHADDEVNHAATYLGDGLIAEAQPGGAIISPVTNYPNAIWSTGRLPAALVPSDRQRDAIVAWQRAHCADPTVTPPRKGVPYGWPDIVAIGVAQKRLGSWINPDLALKDQPLLTRWALNRIDRSDRDICSQLVDAGQAAAGVHLFQHRWPGMVAPQDLRRLLLAA